MVYKRKTGIVRKKVIGDGHLEIKSEHDLQKWCVAKLTAHNMFCFCTDVFNGISFIRDIAGKAIYKQDIHGEYSYKVNNITFNVKILNRVFEKEKVLKNEIIL